MAEIEAPNLARWPFYLGDLLLLTLAGLFLWQSPQPLALGDAALLTACVVLGAALSVCPHVLEYRALMRLAEAQRLRAAALQIQNLESVGQQIAAATASWQAVQDDAAKAVQSARTISESMASEAKAFREFLQKANDAERNHLRLEVEKLHRAEKDWVEVLVRILDHVYALHQAAVRSGHVGLVEQLANFQRACRDAARRVGLAPFSPKPGDPFEPELHQVDSTEPSPSAGARVADTLALGYRFQGQFMRKAVVVLQGSRPEASALSISMINQRRGGPPAVTPPATSRPPETPVPSEGQPAGTAEPAGPAAEAAPAAPAPGPVNPDPAVHP